MHEVLLKRLGGLSLSRKSVVRLTDRPDMTLDVYRGRKTRIQQKKKKKKNDAKECIRNPDALHFKSWAIFPGLEPLFLLEAEKQK